MGNYNTYEDDNYYDIDSYKFYDTEELDDKEFVTEYLDDILFKEDYEEMWLAICELFPEYDFLSYIEEFEEEYDFPYGLMKFKNPSESTLRREKEGVKEFFKELEYNYSNIRDLNYEVTSTLIENGRFEYKYFPEDRESSIFHDDWEADVYIPRLKDDAKTKELNKKLLKPVIDKFISDFGRIKN